MDVIRQKYERETSFSYCLIHKSATNGIAILILFAVMKQTNETHTLKKRALSNTGALACPRLISLRHTISCVH